jgi:protein CpxP
MNRSPRFRSVKLLVGCVAIALAGALSQATFAMPHHGGHGGPGGGMFMHGRMLERMLDGVNATEQQRTQIRQIAQQAAADLKGQREQSRALRQQQLQLFTQPNVDANAAEALRQQMLQQHDQASRRVMQAMLDASRVLTPEQRAQLAERMKQRRQMFERHRDERRSIDGGAPRS